MIERTIVLIKPDAVKRGLIGEIIQRFERAGLKIIGLKMVWLDKETADKFYPKDEKWIETLGVKAIESFLSEGINPKEIFKTDNPSEIGKMIREWLIEYITSGPVVAIVLEGVNAIKVVKKIVGPTEPLKAPPGTIRGDYAHVSIVYSNLKKTALRNIVHAPDNKEEAEKEINLLFKPNELYNYKREIEEVVF